MGDPVYRVIYRDRDSDDFECYATQEEAIEAWNVNHADGVVNWELPSGVHLRDSADVGDKPWLEDPVIEHRFKEKYVFDDEDAFWKFVFYRWPYKTQWRISKHDGKYMLRGRSNDWHAWWATAFVGNIKNKTNAYNREACGTKLGEELE